MNDNHSPLLSSPLLTSKHNIIFSNKIIKKKMKKKKKDHTRDGRQKGKSMISIHTCILIKLEEKKNI